MYMTNTQLDPNNREWFRKQERHGCGARRSHGSIRHGKPQTNAKETIKKPPWITS